MPPTASSQPGYTVKLEVFEGPLDLLLHLIRREEMDIYNIPIARITRQYLDYLETLADLDLDTASEFLLMAATLMDIKSRMLLPRPSAGEFIDGELEIDPRQELVARLLEYKRYKEAATELGDRAGWARRLHSRYGGPGGPPPPAGRSTGLAKGVPGGGDGEDSTLPGPGLFPGQPGGSASPGGAGVGDLSLADLVRALQDVLKELSGTPSREIMRETVTVADRLAELVPLLLDAGEKGFDFLGLLRRSRSKRMAVVTFLALLELLRQGRVRFSQECLFGPITIWALPGAAQWRWPGRD